MAGTSSRTAPKERLGRQEQRRPEKSRRFSVVMADDHHGTREEVCRLLDCEFDVLGAVSDGVRLLEAAAELRPDAIVTDVRMPRLTGIQAAAQLLARGLASAVVALSVYADAHLLNEALEVGILGYVLKVDAAEELIPAVYAALRGEAYLSIGVRDKCSG